MVDYWNTQKGVKVVDHGWGVKAHVPDGLFNPVTTQRIYCHERPWHRVATELAAVGHTIAEICAATGRSRRAVQQALAQPFAQERIARKAAMNAQDEIKEILEKVAPESLRRIAKLAEEASGALDLPTRELAMKADREILDRFLGKPNQPVTSQTAVKPAKEMSDEELEREVNRILTRRNGCADGLEDSSEYS